MTPEQRLRELPKGIMKWYKVEKDSKIGCIVAEYGNSRLIAEALEEDKLCVSQIPLEKLDKFCVNQIPLEKLDKFCVNQVPLEKLDKFCVNQISLEKRDNIKECAMDTSEHCEKCQGNLDSANIDEKESYDIIIAVDIIEYAFDVVHVLRFIRSLLKPDGKLLVAADN